MKKLKFLSIFLLLGLLLGCGPNKPDNIAHNVRITENGFKPGLTPKDPVVRVFDTTVLIKPTWGQANQFASERGDFLIWQIIGVILLGGAIVLIYGRVKDASWLPKINEMAFGALLFVLLAGSITAFKWQSSSIMWNNNKWVPKQQFDKAIKDSGSTKPIWDSLRKDCKIVFGPYECYEKK